MTAKGFNYSSQLVVRATDIDPKCVHMAYIQLSMYGIPAVVIHGNSIILQEYTRWYTPMYVLDKWVWRYPVSLTNERSSDDELLKRITEPDYDRWRKVSELLNQT